MDEKIEPRAESRDEDPDEDPGVERDLRLPAAAAGRSAARVEDAMIEYQGPGGAIEGVCHTEPECRAMYAAIPQELKGRAIEFLRKELAPARDEIVAAIHADPEQWWVPFHFSWGMATRNAIRKAGFGEAHFGVHNLDDIYVYLVEDALAPRESGT